MLRSSSIDRRSPWILPVALLLCAGPGLSGCAGKASQAAPPAPERMEMLNEPPAALEGSQFDTWVTDLASLDDRLGEQLATDVTARCAEAAELRDRICALAEKICELAERYPDRPEVRDRCADGRMRCDRARRAVGERCE